MFCYLVGKDSNSTCYWYTSLLCFHLYAVLLQHTRQARSTSIGKLARPLVAFCVSIHPLSMHTILLPHTLQLQTPTDSRTSVHALQQGQRSMIGPPLLASTTSQLFNVHPFGLCAFYLLLKSMHINAMAGSEMLTPCIEQLSDSTRLCHLTSHDTRACVTS